MLVVGVSQAPQGLVQVDLRVAVLAEELQGVVADQEIPRPDPAGSHREQIGDAMLVVVEDIVGADQQCVEQLVIEAAARLRVLADLLPDMIGGVAAEERLPERQHQPEVLVGQRLDPRQEAVPAQPGHLGDVLDDLLRSLERLALEVLAGGALAVGHEVARCRSGRSRRPGRRGAG